MVSSGDFLVQSLNEELKVYNNSLINTSKLPSYIALSVSQNGVLVNGRTVHGESIWKLADWFCKSSLLLRDLGNIDRLSIKLLDCAN
jgi:hypothetical protein